MFYKKIVITVLLAMILAGCTLAAPQARLFPSPNPLPVESNRTTPTGLAASSLKSSPSPTLIPTSPPVVVPRLSEKAQAFKVTADNFRIVDDEMWVDACFNLPDTQDWMIGEASAQAGGMQLALSGSRLREFEPPADGRAGRRCDTLYFDLPVGIDASDATLTIETLAAPPREGQYCDYLMGVVQPILNQRASGISLACEELPGASNAQVVKKPEGMSQEEAQRIAFSPEYYSVHGPWVFQFQGLPTATPYPTVALDDPDAAPYDLLQTLNQKADASLAIPGWVYVSEDWQHDIDSPNFSTLSDGTPLPRQYRRETWYHLDENRRVDRSVSRLYSEDGKLLETVIFKNGWVQNLALGGEGYAQNPYRLHLNEGYIGNLIANLKDGRGSAGRIEQDGLPSFIFTLDEDIPVPNPEYYDQAILGDQVTAIFEAGSGLLRQVKTIARLADGSLRVLEFMELLVLSGVEPPADVLDLLVTRP